MNGVILPKQVNHVKQVNIECEEAIYILLMT